MSGFRISGGSSNNLVEVNAANQMKVVTETDASANPGNVGASRLFCENDPGAVTGAAYLKSPETSPDFRLRAGMDTVLFTDTFNATAQNSNLWAYTFATLTCTQPGAGTLNFGTVQGTAGTHGAFMRSFQYFPLATSAPLAVEFLWGRFTAELIANEVWAAGLGLPATASSAAPDGVYWKLTSAGLVGVIAYNGNSNETGVLRTLGQLPALGEINKYTIVVGEHAIEWWMDDVLLAVQAVPVANGLPWIAGSQCVYMQKYNTGSVTNTNTVRVSRVGVSLMDVVTSRPWSVSNCVQGLGAYAGQNGQTMGTTQATGTITSGSSPNLPTSAAGSNTTANATGLGGWGAINAAAGAATDFIATSYLNPAGTVNITGRNLLIRGVKITCINTGAAVATTPTTLLWSLAFGHTAVSLATTETASFANNTTHAPRRVQLGFLSAAVATPIGGLYSGDVSFNFDSPIVVRPGEYIATIMKIVVGSATASQTITYNVVFDGSFE